MESTFFVKLLQGKQDKEEVMEESDEMHTISFISCFFVHLGFYILIFVGALSALVRPPQLTREKNRVGYPPLYSRLETFVSLYLLGRLRDCLSNPICSVPGAEVVLKQRVFEKEGCISNFKFTGRRVKCINMVSYNYLGFAENCGGGSDFAIKAIYENGLSTGSTRLLYGSLDIHSELEKLTAEFLGVEDSLSCGMGFATNSLNLPVIISRECLVLSDAKNHSSIILGAKISGATIKVFKHNDVDHLELLLKEAVYYGQNRVGDYKPWKKIFIIVEGMYSMEGTFAPLPQIIALKKKYKAYLYVDEAHSIGAMGKSGRGVVEYYGCNPKDVDILMGTYTKSFGAAGGYIAGSKAFISHMRSNSYASKYAWSMSPPVAAHIVGVLKILMQMDGTTIGQTRLSTMARNTKYFRLKLRQMGLIIYGCEDSPVVPILCYFYSKMAAMVRNLREHKVAVVGAGYPATPFLEGRLRICISACHTKEQLDYVLEVIAKASNEFGLFYSKLPRSNRFIEY
ncbi:serine palmitoyltransferase 2-like [Photinus pyralis]|uniref:serine palmitoyltransferase 2-like n=1 Tax=Photinus pyralis TaxID=7054 RepID=UPI0012677BA4|nr:serine palmitoyltransferase 2-like [Photinus pyralis]